MKADQTLNDTSAGIRKLRNAARNLPVTMEELTDFYRQDLHYIGELTELQVYHYIVDYLNTIKPYAPPPTPTHKELGMVKCSECSQYRCSIKLRTQTRQTCTLYRRCNDYTPKYFEPV